MIAYYHEKGEGIRIGNGAHSGTKYKEDSTTSAEIKLYSSSILKY